MFEYICSFQLHKNESLREFLATLVCADLDCNGNGECEISGNVAVCNCMEGKLMVEHTPLPVINCVSSHSIPFL